MFALADLARSQCVTPPIPTNLTLTVLSPYQIRVQVDAQIPSCNFRAFRSINESAFVPVNSGYPMGFFVDSLRILPTSEICYKVQAFNSCGNSDFTPVVMSNTPAGDTPNQSTPPVPFALTAVANATSIVLNWQLGSFPAVQAQGQNVYIQRSTDGTNFSQLNSIFNRTTYSDATVHAGTLYYYRVRTSNNYGWGTYSDFSNVVISGF